MVAKDDFQIVLDKIGAEETKGLLDFAKNAPTMTEACDFRPLTEIEKKEFVGSLDAKGRKILAELEGHEEFVTESTEDSSATQSESQTA